MRLLICIPAQIGDGSVFNVCLRAVCLQRYFTRHSYEMAALYCLVMSDGLEFTVEVKCKGRMNPHETSV